MNPDCGIKSSVNYNIQSLNSNQHEITNERNMNHQQCISDKNTSHNIQQTSMKQIYQKLKDIQIKLHSNNVSDKKASCFWCTCPFANPPIYIPKQQVKDEFEVYGCFCSPECASAYLFNEHLDNSTKWERYSLLNNIYSSIYEYDEPIKPAPNPHYLLDKFYGDLTIEEYRRLLKNHSLLMIIDKPLTRIYPELHENNNELNINTNYFQKDKKGKKEYTLSRNKVQKKVKSIFDN